MAGDWIKIQHALPDKPEVVKMAAELDIDQDAVVGKLIRLWVWADQQCAIGDALSVTEAFLNRITFCDRFAQSLRSVGWLTGDAEELTLPNFSRHNGKTAKTRGNSQKRMESLRSRDAASVTDNEQKRTESVTREEKRREEINTIPDASEFKPPTLQEVTTHCETKQNGVDPVAFMDHYEKTGWRTKAGPVKSWKRCVGTFAKTASHSVVADNAPPDGFDEFWAAYPKKLKMMEARAAYATALTVTGAATLLAGAAGYAKSVRDTEERFKLSAANWLEAQRWTDQHPKAWYEEEDIAAAVEREISNNAF